MVEEGLLPCRRTRGEPRAWNVRLEIQQAETGRRHVCPREAGQVPRGFCLRTRCLQGIAIAAKDTLVKKTEQGVEEEPEQSFLCEAPSGMERGAVCRLRVRRRGSWGCP